ncbi:hypothetical protein [Streptomyces sp. FL07-04A]|uniref:hypothetical protein n=1 Tax=Streptomyces sp. FL07-04A TaxID=3028658 RepID=UPI0039F6C9BF
MRFPSLLLFPTLILLLTLLPAAGPAAAADVPAVTLSTAQAGAGGSVTVNGSGWRPSALVMLLICGQATPARGVVGGTNSCANADGRAVTADAHGRFSLPLPVAEPPPPCPCVVHAATATGAKAQADAVFQVAGHPVRPLPAATAGGRLSVLTDTRLEGSGGLLTWFGAPPSRTLVFTVGNVGTGSVENPVFRVGTAHGVFAPQWDERQWHGTIRPGGKARVELPVELAAGAHGDYTVSLEYGGKVLAEQPWGVGRPWGVTLFWILLCLVVPAALFRIGMAVVDRVRPRPATRRPARARRPGRLHPSEVPAAESAVRSQPTLPWFTPDTAPDGPVRPSARHDDRPTTPMSPVARHDDRPTTPTSPVAPTDDRPTTPMSPTAPAPAASSASPSAADPPAPPASSASPSAPSGPVSPSRSTGPSHPTSSPSPTTPHRKGST